MSVSDVLHAKPVNARYKTRVLLRRYLGHLGPNAAEKKQTRCVEILTCYEVLGISTVAMSVASQVSLQWTAQNLLLRISTRLRLLGYLSQMVEVSRRLYCMAAVPSYPG